MSQNPVVVEQFRIEIGNPSDRIHIAIFSPDGSKILVLSQKSTQIWSTETGKLLVSFREPFSLKSGIQVAWQPHGNRILQYYDWPYRKSPATIWDSETGTKIATLEEKQGIIHAEWNARSDRILTVGNLATGSLIKDFTYSVRDETGRVIRTEELTPYDVHFIIFSRSGDEVITSFRSRKGQKPVRVFDADTGRLERSYDHDLQKVNPMTYAIFADESPNGEYLCGQIDLSKGVTCWSANDDSKTVYSFLDTKASGDSVLLSFSNDSKSLAILRSRAKVIEIADAATGELRLSIGGFKEVRKLAYSALGRHRKPESSRFRDAWSYDGQYYVAYDVENEVSIWDIPNKRLVSRRKAVWDSDYDWFVGTLATDYEGFSFNRRNNLLLSVSNQIVRIWEPSSGDLLHEIVDSGRKRDESTFQRWIASWSPNGDLLLTAADQNRALKVWSVK